MSEHICDCGAVYSHPDQIISCAQNYHFREPSELSRLLKDNARLRQREAQLVAGNDELREAIKPIIVQGADQCSPEHSGLSPVEITLTCAQLRRIAVALATQSTSK